jgi:hypothetical protein
VNLKILFIFTILLAFGCGDPKIDTSSDEKMKASIEQVRQSLPSNKRAEFDDAIKIIAFSSLDLKNIFSMGSASLEKNTNQYEKRSSREKR